jgi:exopolysaccharide production protein ExoZ
MTPTKTSTVQTWLSQRFELSRGRDGDTLHAMSGLRGFAVFLVFLVHFDANIKTWLVGSPLLAAFSDALHSIGETGVDLFFLLSGFLTYASLMARPRKFIPFLTRRIVRIYSPFLPVFLLYIGLSYAFPAENKIPAGFHDAAVYLLQNLLLMPGLFSTVPLITIAWSLSYIMFSYLSIPALIGIFRLRERSAAVRVGLFMSIAIALAVWCALRGGPSRLIMFIAGIVLYEGMQNKTLRTPGSFWSLLALGLGFIGALHPEKEPAHYVIRTWLLFGAYTLVCLTAFRNPASLLAKVFSWTPLRWLGNMSYSYFLIHGLALKTSFRVLQAALPPEAQHAGLYWPLLPALFALSLLPAALLFLAVERPFLQARQPR